MLAALCQLGLWAPLALGWAVLPPGARAGQDVEVRSWSGSPETQLLVQLEQWRDLEAANHPIGHQLDSPSLSDPGDIPCWVSQRAP